MKVNISLKSALPTVLLAVLSALLLAVLLAGCGQQTVDSEYADWTITVSGDGIDGELSFTLAELAALEGGTYEAVYSTVNNWPNPGFYAARGVTLEALLTAAGVFDSAATVNIASEDGYNASFTREQLFGSQYSYPAPGESDEGAQEVKPIIAYSWRQGADELTEMRPDVPCLIVGQSNYLEHNNPVFVEGVTRVVVSNESEQWAPPYLWPDVTEAKRGDSIKLQHDNYSLVKIFYTLDGSDPDVFSPMYNPSTYQPELNRPLTVDGDLTVRAFVSGYGKQDSEIVEFTIKCLD